jgi:hypothetical protein
MSEEFLSAYSDALRQSQKALSTMVRISHEEVSMIVVRELISRRNADTCKAEYRDAFDTILKGYFLQEEEFDKYVIRKEPIDE